MRRLSKEQGQKLATALLAQARATLPERAAEWTQFDASDPGVTLLEVLAYLVENLLSPKDRIPPRCAALAQRLADAARAPAGAGAPRGTCALQRVNYSTGRLLTAEDFRQEQTYLRARLQRRNRLLHGAGIVTGLQVTVPPAKDSRRQRVALQPGLALDPRGEELEVCTPQLVPLPARGEALLLQLLFAERLTVPAPVLASDATGGEQQFSRVEETVTIVLAPTAQADAVSIARLTFSRGGWRVDRGYKPPRART